MSADGTTNVQPTDGAPQQSVPAPTPGPSAYPMEQPQEKAKLITREKAKTGGLYALDVVFKGASFFFIGLGLRKLLKLS